MFEVIAGMWTKISKWIRQLEKMVASTQMQSENVVIFPLSNWIWIVAYSLWHIFDRKSIISKNRLIIDITSEWTALSIYFAYGFFYEYLSKLFQFSTTKHSFQFKELLKALMMVLISLSISRFLARNTQKVQSVILCVGSNEELRTSNRIKLGKSTKTTYNSRAKNCRKWIDYLKTKTTKRERIHPQNTQPPKHRENTKNGIDTVDEAEGAVSGWFRHFSRSNYHSIDSRLANGHAYVERSFRCTADACQNLQWKWYRSEWCVFSIQTKISITVSRTVDQIFDMLYDNANLNKNKNPMRWNVVSMCHPCVGILVRLKKRPEKRP